MNYLQYAFYAINIYLEKVIEDFCWGNTRARQSGNLATCANLVCRRHWFCKRLIRRYLPFSPACNRAFSRSRHSLVYFLQNSWPATLANNPGTKSISAQKPPCHFWQVVPPFRIIDGVEYANFYYVNFTVLSKCGCEFETDQDL
jgi:hypothetical protein